MVCALMMPIGHLSVVQLRACGVNDRLGRTVGGGSSRASILFSVAGSAGFRHAGCSRADMDNLTSTSTGIPILAVALCVGMFMRPSAFASPA